jgi:flagellar hook capping protein FlgD
VSNPITGIGGNALYNWNAPVGAGNRTAAVTAGGQTFAQIAAGLGIDPQTLDAGGATDGSGGAGSPGSTGSTDGSGTGTTGGSGTTGTSGVGGTGGSGGPTGSPNGTANGVGSTTGSGASATGANGTAPPGQTSGTGATSGSGTTGSTGSTGSGSIADLSGTDTFLKLLVAQLKNQDPTSPMDDQAFVTELAQFNTVEQMINLKQSMDAQTTSQQASEGIGLLGRTISYATTAVGSNNTVTSQGLVTGVSLADGQVELKVGTQQVALTAVTGVSA